MTTTLEVDGEEEEGQAKTTTREEGQDLSLDFSESPTTTHYEQQQQPETSLNDKSNSNGDHANQVADRESSAAKGDSSWYIWVIIFGSLVMLCGIVVAVIYVKCYHTKSMDVSSVDFDSLSVVYKSY